MGIQLIYSVAIYCRLSVDDGTNLESMSIANQKTMLTEYVKKQGWKLANIYVDDGYSGVNFERPAFQRMIQDIEQGRINLVIVKDLSRLGRNYILCGQYTEIYFPEKNVRFIALNDGIDTLYSNNDIAPFKNILNDMYAKDISVKIRSSLHAKARKGEFLAPYAPYGFLKSSEDKHILIINEEVAPHIKRMFELSASGVSTKKIAKILEEDGVLTPLDYRNFKKYNPVDGIFQKKYTWDGAVVRWILRNPVYVGHNVQCRKRVQSYRTKKIVPNKREDWIIVENTHEAIVSQELFDTVQKALDGRLRFVKRTGEPQIFSKLFYCAECGHCMLHHDRTNHPKYYSCGKYRADGVKACTSHHITYDNLYEIVLKDIQKHVKLVEEDEGRAIQEILSVKCSAEEKQLAKAKKEWKQAKKRLEEMDSRIKRVYEDNLSGKIPDDLFSVFITDYQNEKQTLTETVHTLEDEVSKLQENRTDVSRFIALLKEYTNITTIDRQILTALIDKITISEDRSQQGKKNKEQTITIYYKFVGAV